MTDTMVGPVDRTFDAAADGVRVRKSVASDASDLASVSFRLTSERDDSVAVRLRDPIPTGAAIRLGSADAGRWTTADGVATYERTLSPGETATTAYTSRSAEAGDLATPPSLAVTDGADDETTAATRSAPESGARGAGESAGTAAGAATAAPEGDTAGGPVVQLSPQDRAAGRERDASSEMRGPTAGVEADPEAGDEFSAPGDEVAMTELVRAALETPATTPSDGAATEAGPDSGTPSPAVGVADGRSHPIDGDRGVDRAGAAASDSTAAAESTAVATGVRHLADACPDDRPDRSPTAVVARVRYLQARFREQVAVADAAAAVIDDCGDGSRALSALAADVERVRDHLDRLRATHSALRWDVDALDAHQHRLDARDAAVDDELDALADALEAMDDVLRALKADVDGVATFQERLTDALG